MPIPIAARLRGLYAITPDVGENLSAKLDKLLGAGVRLLQYRRKALSPPQRLTEAADFCARAQAAGATFIVNDDLELALAVGADGVHWGRHDVSLAALETAAADARKRAQPGFIIGLSCYNDFSRAEFAAGDKNNKLVDYIAFGSIFASNTKPDADFASLSLIQRAKLAFPDTPVVAIGGITRDNVGEVVAAGADAAAVITDLFSAPVSDIAARAALFQAAFQANFDSPYRHSLSPS